MKRVITYRSVKLKDNIVSIATEDSVAIARYRETDEYDEDFNKVVKLSRAQKKAMKAERKLAKKNGGDNLFIEEDEDLSETELEEQRIHKLINKDSFYDALEPIDANKEKLKHGFSKHKLIVIGALFGIIVIVIIIMLFIINNQVYV